MKFKRV